MSFADLKRKSQNNFSYLQKELEKSSSGKNVDERFWKPEVDAAGNGYAVIRFLPATEGESIPWAKVYSHAFQGVGGWYIENSLTTINEKDPVGEVNRRLWNSGADEDKETARKQKRKLSYYSNIYVVKDQLNPDNEGKVFLYKYGKKIHDKIVSAMQPQFEDEEPINPFDMWKGADFRIKIQTIGGYWNYDKSDFAPVSALGGFDDAKLEEIWKSQYSLKEFTDPANFKSYEQLEERLNTVLNKSARATVRSFDGEENEAVYAEETVTQTPTPSGFGDKVKELSQTPTSPDLDYFASLAEND